MDRPFLGCMMKYQVENAAVRALAFKWIRIAFRCWKDGVLYDDARYIQSLRRRASPLTAILGKPVLS
jgi:hypothetical protein